MIEELALTDKRETCLWTIDAERGWIHAACGRREGLLGYKDRLPVLVNILNARTCPKCGRPIETKEHD